MARWTGDYVWHRSIAKRVIALVATLSKVLITQNDYIYNILVKYVVQLLSSCIQGGNFFRDLSQ